MSAPNLNKYWIHVATSPTISESTSEINRVFTLLSSSDDRSSDDSTAEKYQTNDI